MRDRVRCGEILNRHIRLLADMEILSFKQPDEKVVP